MNDILEPGFGSFYTTHKYACRQKDNKIEDMVQASYCWKVGKLQLLALLQWPLAVPHRQISLFLTVSSAAHFETGI